MGVDYALAGSGQRHRSSSMLISISIPQSFLTYAKCIAATLSILAGTGRGVLGAEAASRTILIGGLP